MDFCTLGSFSDFCWDFDDVSFEFSSMVNVRGLLLIWFVSFFELLVLIIFQISEILLYPGSVDFNLESMTAFCT